VGWVPWAARSSQSFGKVYGRSGRGLQVRGNEGAHEHMH